MVQVGAAADSAAVKPTGAEATFLCLTGVWEADVYLIIWACTSVAEQKHYLRCDVPNVHDRVREETCICLC